MVGNLTVNGKFTLGENIADNGGIALALAAYKSFAKDTDVLKQRLPGFKDMLDGDKLFFVSYASAWCGKSRPQEAERLIRVDPHSPGTVCAAGAGLH